MQMSVMRFSSVLVAVAMLAGCGSSAPARYHTLQAPPLALASRSGTANYMIEVLPVSVAPQVDQPQIMLRTGQGSVVPLYSERWTAPLGAELHAALSDGLTRDLGVLDVGIVRATPGTPVWRVLADVQRFDMNQGGPVVLDVTWRLRPVGFNAPTLSCRSVVTIGTAAEGINALVAAQQQAVALLAHTMAAAIRHGGQHVLPTDDRVVSRGCITLADGQEAAKNSGLP